MLEQMLLISLSRLCLTHVSGKHVSFANFDASQPPQCVAFVSPHQAEMHSL